MKTHSNIFLQIFLGLLLLAPALSPGSEPAVRSESTIASSETATPTSAPIDPSTASAEEKPRLRLTSTPQTIHGGIQVPMLVATGEYNKFCFLPPLGWRVGSDAAHKRIELTRPQTGSRITVDLVEASMGRMDETTHGVWRERILARFPDAKALNALSLSGLGGIGPAVDLEWRTTSGSLRRSRAGILPFPGGALEYSLQGTAEKIGQDFQALNQLLLSFRQAPMDGKLEFPIVTPE